jgi:hypothetical protein
MSTLKRLVLPFVLVVAALSILGCGNVATTPLTPQEIASNAVSAYKDVKTAKIAMTMVTGMNIEGGKQPMKIDMKADATGSMDIAATRMSMLMNADMNVPMAGEQKTSTEMYIVDNYLYMKATVQGAADQWLKTKLSSTMWQQQNQLDQQIEMLKTAIKVESMGEEVVGGTACYVLSVTPDMAALAGFLASELQQGTSAGILKNVDLGKMFKSVAIKEWVSKRDYLPLKVDMSMSLEMSPEDVGAKSTDFTKMTMDMAVQGNYSDYNKPVSITLPAEAAGAKETPATTP